LHDLSSLIRQPHVEALIIDREPAVVEAELVEDRGVEVVDADWVLDDGPAMSSVWPWVRPPWKPPPAIQMLKAKGWWSRPSLASFFATLAVFA